jgi:Tol biopolymer transport system component
MMRMRTPDRLVVVLGTLLFSFALPAAAHAAFPGRNGLIAFSSIIESRIEADKDFVSPLRGIAPHSRRTRTLVGESRRFETPIDAQFSPNGRMLAFIFDGGEAQSPDIWLKPLRRGARPRRMIGKPPGTNFHVSATSSQTDAFPEWSPDGQSIVFVRATFSEPQGGRVALRIYHRGHSRPLAENAADPAWSVRNEIAFVRPVELPDHTNEDVIFVVRPDGSGLRRLTAGSHPDWSPDGRRLVFERNDRDRGDSHIAIISRNGRGLRQVTKDRRCNDDQPSFSPGGGQLLFERIEGGDCPTEGLVITRADGRRLRRLVRRDNPTPEDWQPLPQRRR